MSGKPCWLLGVVLGVWLASSASLLAQEKAIQTRQFVSGPVEVTITDEKPVLTEPVLPVDPTQHINVQTQPSNMSIRLTIDNKMLHLGYIYTIFKVDGQVMYSNQALKFNQPLPRTATGKARQGYLSVHRLNDLLITQTVEVVPARSKGDKKRRMDSALVRYTIENTGNTPHNVAMRVGMDMYLVNNDGALFAAPNFPNKILDGVELKGKDVPKYLQVLQQPNLQNPGFVAHFTYNLGNAVEKPNRVIVTNLGAGAPDNWNMRALPANGDSAMSMYWDEKILKPKSRREIAYAYGQGVASGISNEGNLQVNLAGSFEPGKTFSILGYVYDPAPGQAISLELPKGMERVEGKEVQPVPMHGDEGMTMVFWKARVLEPGTFHVRVHSNTGVTQTKIVTIRRVP